MSLFGNKKNINILQLDLRKELDLKINIHLNYIFFSIENLSLDKTFVQPKLFLN